MPENSNLIVQPQNRVVDPTPARAKIGGVNVDYQPNPELAVVLQTDILQNGAALIGTLSAMLNVQNAIVREMLAARESRSDTDAEVRGIQADVKKVQDFMDELDAKLAAAAGDSTSSDAPQAEVADTTEARADAG